MSIFLQSEHVTADIVRAIVVDLDAHEIRAELHRDGAPCGGTAWRRDDLGVLAEAHVRATASPPIAGPVGWTSGPGGSRYEISVAVIRRPAGFLGAIEVLHVGRADGIPQRPRRYAGPALDAIGRGIDLLCGGDAAW